LESFGEKLRKQREQRGITLEAVANTTKISTRMLKALEDEHFDQLPGGVFNKGFVRAYARQVGLDEEEAISDYLAALGESQVRSQPVVPNFRASPARPAADVNRTVAARTRSSKNITQDRRIQPDRRVETRRTEDRFQEDRIIKLNSNKLDRIAEVEGRQNEGGQNRTRQDEDEVSRPRSTSPPSFLNLSPFGQAGEEEPEFEHATARSRPHQQARWRRLAIPLVLLFLVIALWAVYRHNHPKRYQATSSAPTGPAPSASQSAAVAPEKPSATANAVPPKAPDTQAPRPASRPEEPVSDLAEVTPPHPQPSQSKPLPALTLVIRASETSWVAITADGQPVAQETLIAPANTSVRATHEITVKAGNAAGVSFLLNGKEFPASGGEGEVHTYTFDANGLRDSPATPADQPTN
jgi:cytoskeletal protein RodZ